MLCIEGFMSIVFAINRKVHFNYFVEETVEAGIVLFGSEVKAIRAGMISFNDGFAAFKNNELFLYNVHISEYKYSSVFSHEPDRLKKLLLHKQELKRLKRKVEEKGITLVPIDFHYANHKIKVTLGLCKGKKMQDKRETIKNRDIERDIARELRERNR